MKKLAAAALAGLLAFSGAAGVSAETETPEVFAAFGDSLAAGQTPDRAIDSGYADLIAQELAREGSLGFFTKDFAFPGLTSAGVLERVKSPEAQELLGKATLITVSAGANDLLSLVRTEPASGSITFSQLAADRAMNNARKNIRELLAELSSRAPEAEVYVMGYYFPYPHANDLQKPGLARQLLTLNAILKQEAEKAGAVYVPVADEFGMDATAKIPLPGDVHPTIQGYQEMANAFLDVYEPALGVTDRELPDPRPVSFEELMEKRASEGEVAAAETAPANPISEMEYITVSKLRHYT
ncbi:SGNH/GDSL hydrolase family protein [Indiicoccus explosivorum]|uniref:SGNH/GDSL hydrolase family protein n=1 Tax=Indiicoccus explosivorum TaxID=1917864 RepID=UPI000B43ACC1|nr:SGNH/GDSL hydrolase family protein [Indiicoccus explosivorum]